MAKKYTTTYNVPFYQSSATRQMQLSAILGVALQASGKQSMELERSDEWIHEKFGLVWIVTEYAIKITRLPRFKETVTIETEAKVYNKIFCYRDFTYRDQAGNELLVIHSTWVLMNFESRKISPIVEEVVAPYDCVFDKKIKRGHKFAKFTGEVFEKEQVRYADIDSNQHVNNSIYIDWAINPLGFDFLTTHQPKEIYIRYNHEVMPDSQVEISLASEGDQTHHSINDGDCQVDIVWERP